MKTRLLCTTALAAVMAVSLAGGTVVHAAEDSAVGTGVLEVIENTDSNGKPDPEDPDKEVDPKDPGDVTETGNQGPITIDRIARLNFGQWKLDVTPGEKVIPAESIAGTQTDPANPTAAGRDVLRGPWVQWTDKRTGTNHKYTINANMTKTFTLKGSTDTIDKAKIEYTNGLLNSAQDLANWPTTDVLNFTLSEAGGKQLVFDNNASTGSVGIGTWTAEFGQSDEYKTETNKRGDSFKGEADNSVFLKFDGGQALSKGVYEAEITWTIEYTP
ncbi:WxL domain-containing protein [Enterococcus sp. LJL128]